MMDSWQSVDAWCDKAEIAAKKLEKAMEADDFYERAAANDGLLESLAEFGCSGAEYTLGRRYETGDGVSADGHIAHMFYMRADSHGSVPAATGLGRLYEAGVGVARDMMAARRWYEKAAAGGEPEAEYRLGCFYCAGVSVPKNIDTGVALLMRAAKDGVVEAQTVLLRDYAVKASGGKLVEW